MIKLRARLILVLLALLLLGAVIALFINHKTNIQYWYLDLTRGSQAYTLFIGSSTIARLDPYLVGECVNPVIYGFNNGTSENIRSYLTLARLKNAKQVVLYIGENDIAQGKDSAKTFEQVSSIVNILKSKTNAKIVILNLKYSPARARFFSDFTKFNQMLSQQFSNDKRVYLLAFDQITRNSEFLEDGVHLTDKTYQNLATHLNYVCDK